MAKVIIELDLYEDSNEIKLLLDSKKYFSSLLQIQEFVRSKRKYSDLTESEESLLQEISELIPDLDDIE